MSLSNTVPIIGVLTVSDRAWRREYPDEGGPAVCDYLATALTGPTRIVHELVPDEPAVIAQALRELCDNHGCCLVVTTGGTGPAPRDLTPEATREVCERELPGFGEAMREASLRDVPTAILSRQTAGIRGRSLVLNLPGRPAAVARCLDAVIAAIPYCVELIGGPVLRLAPSTDASTRPAFLAAATIEGTSP